MKLHFLCLKSLTVNFLFSVLHYRFRSSLQIQPSRLRAVAVVILTMTIWLSGLPFAHPMFSANAQRKLSISKVIRQEPLSATSPRQDDKPKASTPTSSQADDADDAAAGLKVKLYYLRDATKIVAVLNAIASDQTSELHGLIITSATEDEIILYGTKKKRNQARRIIVTLDLPRPGINMEMWGIQISNANQG